MQQHNRERRPRAAFPLRPESRGSEVGTNREADAQAIAGLGPTEGNDDVVLPLDVDRCRYVMCGVARDENRVIGLWPGQTHPVGEAVGHEVVERGVELARGVERLGVERDPVGKPAAVGGELEIPPLLPRRVRRGVRPGEETTVA